MRNETLTNVFWGFFLIWFGTYAVFLKLSIFDVLETIDKQPVFALGTGVLMLGLNLTRSALHLSLSVLTIGLGALLVIIYAPLALTGYSIPLTPTLLIIAGAALVIGALRARNYL